MDDAIYKNSNSASKKRENIVFSPLSLAGTMAIVLLASGGHTFDEVAKILGLESGVDVSGHSEVVHEMFGLLIGMVGRNKNNPGPQATYANGIFIQVKKIFLNFNFCLFYKKKTPQTYVLSVLCS